METAAAWATVIPEVPDGEPAIAVGRGNSDSHSDQRFPYHPPVLFFLLYALARRWVRVLSGRSNGRALEIENAVLRHQLAVLRRSVKRPRLSRLDRVFLAAASRLLPRERWSSLLVTP